jgi:hypothetical protein
MDGFADPALMCVFPPFLCDGFCLPSPAPYLRRDASLPSRRGRQTAPGPALLPSLPPSILLVPRCLDSCGRGGQIARRKLASRRLPLRPFLRRALYPSLPRPLDPTAWCRYRRCRFLRRTSSHPFHGHPTTARPALFRPPSVPPSSQPAFPLPPCKLPLPPPATATSTTTPSAELPLPPLPLWPSAPPLRVIRAARPTFGPRRGVPPGSGALPSPPFPRPPWSTRGTGQLPPLPLSAFAVPALCTAPPWE